MKHLKKNNRTYLSHLLFAGVVGFTLLFRGVIFVLHATFPFCGVPERWNLENTIEKLQKWNEHITRRKNK